jgi:hypothetical protein
MVFINSVQYQKPKQYIFVGHLVLSPYGEDKYEMNTESVKDTLGNLSKFLSDNYTENAKVRQSTGM